MGALGIDTTSNATDQSSGTAGPDSPENRGSGAQAWGGSIAIGARAKYLSPGSVDLANNRGQLGGYDLRQSKNNTINVTGTDPQVLDAFKNVFTASQNAAGLAQEKSTSLVSDLVAKYQALAEAKDSTSILQKPFLWLGGGFLIVIAIFFLSRK